MMTAGIALSHRSLLGALSAAAVGTLPWLLAAPGQDKLETTSVRLVLDPSTCLAPEYVAEPLLRDEGFTSIEYLEVATDVDDQAAIAQGKADFAVDFALKYVTAIDAGGPPALLSPAGQRRSLLKRQLRAHRLVRRNPSNSLRGR